MKGQLDKIKKELKHGNNKCLKFIFEDYGSYCISNLQKKFNCQLEDAEDILIDAIINFRDKILNGKITYLTSIRNYIYTTCVNMYKEKLYRQNQTVKHKSNIKLYLYEEMEPEPELSPLMKTSLKAFDQLGEPCQKILRYFYIYKMNMDEIADQMELANANVAKVSKARCFKKWKSIIDKQREKI